MKIVALSFPTMALALIAVFMILAPSEARAQPADELPPDSPQYAIREGLKLIRDGKFSDWMTRWCSPTELCTTDIQRKSLKKFNLPAMQRLAPDCLKGEGNTVQVTKIEGDPVKDKSVKIFIQCNPKGSPRPFHMIREDGWKFMKL
jgi:hypothetical protein